MEHLQYTEFSNIVEAQVQKMMDQQEMVLVKVDIDKDVLLDTYLSAFPEEVNPIFRERRSYDCNCCKNYLRNMSTMIGIRKDLSIATIFDGVFNGYFQDVADKMKELVLSAPIKDVFLTRESSFGVRSNLDNRDSSIRWTHLYTKVNPKFVKANAELGCVQSEQKGHYTVLKRSLDELTIESAEVVHDLIDANNLYRGQEYLHSVKAFIDLKSEYDTLEPNKKDLFVWYHANKLGNNARIRNTAIGTLLVDISSGVDLERAVTAFESKVAAPNYKRSSAVITTKMVEQLQEKIRELGYEDSLYRRSATLSDISINDVLYTAVHDTHLNVFDELKADTQAVISKKLSTQKVDYHTFINDVLPNSKKIELLFEDRLKSNLMTMVGPVHESAKNMFNWNNNISWTYAGDVTDAIKERVKEAGGSVDGIFRVSLSWHSLCDLDLSVITPSGKRVCFSNKKHGSIFLDLDYNGLDKHSATDPVENIIFSNSNGLENGVYKFYVHQYNRRSKSMEGFTLQVENDGELQNYSYGKSMRTDEKYNVISARWNGKEFKIIDVWAEFDGRSSAAVTHNGIKTSHFVPVSMIMKSPNHWHDQAVGNEHTFFIVKDCKFNGKIRGFFNEFLTSELRAERKALEVLGSKLMFEPSEDQLSGFGFSSTIKNSFIVRVTQADNNKANCFEVSI